MIPTSEPRWPNLFVLGVAKAGTTSLASYLEQHPEIYFSPVKEPHYFSRVRPAPHLAFLYPHVEDRERYLELFRAAGDHRWVGEASTSYFWDGDALGRIRRVSPESRHLVVLRHPVERAYSHYLNMVREGEETRAFGEAVDDELELAGRPQAWGVDSLYLDSGLYARRLEHAFETLGRDRLRVLVFEEMVSTPREHLREIFDDLEIDPAPADSIRLDVLNPYARPRGPVARRLLGSARARGVGRLLFRPKARQVLRRLLMKRAPKPAMPAAERRRLEDHYRDDVAACERILGRALPWRLGDAAPEPGG
ncbi:MAG: sulfotransferase [Thermoanaerobaculia bacterium]|nr:sulfotransferase [Thermoanaerobaculia bacterium]